MGGEEALAWGFFNRLAEPEAVLCRRGRRWPPNSPPPSFGHAMTKTMLHQEWAMGVDEAIEAEAQAQAICMQTGTSRAYHAFVAKQKAGVRGRLR